MRQLNSIALAKDVDSSLPSVYLTCKFDSGEDLHLAIPDGVNIMELSDYFITFGLFIREEEMSNGIDA